jgi:hypothetical protein
MPAGARSQKRLATPVLDHVASNVKKWLTIKLLGLIQNLHLST